MTNADAVQAVADKYDVRLIGPPLLAQRVANDRAIVFQILKRNPSNQLTPPD
jgi:hypothetical protein